MSLVTNSEAKEKAFLFSCLMEKRTKKKEKLETEGKDGKIV